MSIDAPAFSPPVRAPVCVALSGGPDSVALLHALAHDAQARADGLRALHVHHGMQDAADSWVAHCVAICASLDVPLAVAFVDVGAHAGL
ncbi:ATP-binding protein, partial [Cognatilysobacter lacus]